MPERDVANLLWYSYQTEVELRGGKFDPTDELKEKIKSTATMLTNSSKKGLMYSGTCGNGKTTIVKAIQGMINYLANMGILAKPYKSLSIYHARDLVSLLADDAKKSDIINTPLLAIDDMGVEPTEVLNYGNVFSPIIDLIEKRYDKMMFTIITTNLTPSELREKYGVRINDRLREMLMVMVFTNESYRK